MKKNGKYCNSKKGLNMKPLALLLALALVVGGVVGGTIAWLTAQTNAVTNTFTVGDIDIKLEETTGNDYPFVPGDTKTKDPKVTVLANSEKCYLFIKVTEENNIEVGPDGAKEMAMQYTVDSAWTAVPKQTGYWYMTVNKGDNTAKPILTNNQVKVSPYVTKDSLLETAQFKLTFDAAAVQFDNIVAKDGKTAVEVAFEQIQWN